MVFILVTRPILTDVSDLSGGDYGLLFSWVLARGINLGRCLVPSTYFAVYLKLSLR
jgi:hypothetical protein